MHPPLAFLGILALLTMTSGQSNLANKTWVSKRGKVFSLFNIVHFKNDGCRSSQASGGTAASAFRNGTCYTASECGSKGGTAAGGCAAGFGVCCVFVTQASGGVIAQNCSYIQNPGFPAGITTATGAITYTINRQCPSVCSLRLDFERLELNGLQLVPATATSATCQDTFGVTLNNNGPLIPVLCGTNTGQHMYLDIGSASSNTATLTFTLLATSNANRAWDIKVTQVPCGASSSPPDDCLQFYEGLTGRFTTFNYKTDGTGNYLPNQHYSACIRQEEGYCCIEYLPCAASNAFNLPAAGMATPPAPAATPGVALTAQHDTVCVVRVTAPSPAMPTAYLGIGGSSGNCVPGTNSGLTSTYCGGALSTVTGVAAANAMEICDCTPPFRLDFFSTTTTSTMGTTTSAPPPPLTNTNTNGGVCVTWMQIPCN